ncbi:hypothetical protein SAY87_005344 [Trapa incisa]|uniref:non-specific serine/threonine protein kinase n=1 Tax=Trapa incisa TaxID=236973 RepID=A0AAN7K5P5_9MYRT|nr:hypothetical protein SAY87_005344 [Trapa incisa]
MGNCFAFFAEADGARGSRGNSGVSKNSSNNNRSSSSARSSLAVPSYSERRTASVSSLPIPRTEGEILSSLNLKAFSFNEMKNSTRNFRDEYLIGEGGFGCVFKGWIDEHTLTASKPGTGMVVAVKKLKSEGFQGHKEWLTEVDYLGQLHHPNLVKLIGYCLEGENRLLVYEYMPRGSLENHLFRRGAQPLPWAVRMKVAMGAARGLCFLHDADSPVIYRDFKASNILLDVDYNAKLSDFGLAKAGPTGDKTHVSTQVMGTRGYAAPEYVATGGVEHSLVEWAKPYLGDKRKVFRIMDTKLEGQYPKKGAHAVATLALRCLNLDRKIRPKMSEVLEALEQLEIPKDPHRSSKFSGDRALSPRCPLARTIRHHTLMDEAATRHISPDLAAPFDTSGPSKPAAAPLQEEHHRDPPLTKAETQMRIRGGWKTMPLILGNETFERLATFGLVANFMVYLMTVYHMDQVSASNLISIWSGLTNFAPLGGAFIADACAGRFLTIAVGSMASFMGMATITLTAWLPQLHPPPCPVGLPRVQCKGPEGAQVAALAVGLCLLSIGAGGVRPCSIPFGVDQFDVSTAEGQKGISSYFNWYYATFNVVIIITLTLIVYIQDSFSWVVGFGIPTALMFCALLFFFVGTRIYIHVPPEGSVFTGIIQVFAAAYRKRLLKLPPGGLDAEARVLYDPPPAKDSPFQSKLPLTGQYRFLNKAAIVVENDLDSDGCRKNGWRLCSIQQLEEAKCLLKIGPVWSSGIVSLTALSMQMTFTLSQALKMDRHLGSYGFQIPAGSVTVISMFTITIWLPIYDHLFVPALRRVTGVVSGITQLQRMGIGVVFSVLSMLVSGVVEERRRTAANAAHPNLHGVAPMTVMWLAPQLVLVGFFDAFNLLGQLEFYNREFPDRMKSIGNSLFFCSYAGASYLCAITVNVVHHVTGGHGRPDWLTADINLGRLDYFYYLLAGMGALNFVYFLHCARRYRYKGSVAVEYGPGETHLDLELTKA